MSELKEERKIYYIPDNYIEEGRVFQGRIKVKNLIDAIVLAAAFSVIGFVILSLNPYMTLQGKISMFVFLCIPPALLGIVGFNGDSLSVAAKAAKKWMKNKQMMLYNPTPKLLKRDPLLTVVNQSGTIDSIIEVLSEEKQKNIQKKAEVNIIEGKDYKFARDEYVDKYTKEKKGTAGKETYNYDNPAEKTAAVRFDDSEDDNIGSLFESPSGAANKASETTRMERADLIFDDEEEVLF